MDSFVHCIKKKKKNLQPGKEKLYTIYFSPVCSGMLPMISVTWINNSQCTYSVVISTCCAQFNIITTAVMDTSFGQHSIVLYFRFPQGWAIAGKDDQFCFALSEHFQSRLVPNYIHSTFHNQLEHSVDWLQWLLHLLCGHHLSILGAGSLQPRAAAKNGQGARKVCALLLYEPCT